MREEQFANPGMQIAKLARKLSSKGPFSVHAKQCNTCEDMSANVIELVCLV
jgi:hypothetical protein